MLRLSRRHAIRTGVAAIVALGLAAVTSTAFAVTLDEIKERGYVRVAVANEIPYGYMGTDGEAHGAGPDVAKAVLAEMGLEDIQWTVTSFGSLIPAVKAGRVDMVAAEMAILPQRCEQVNYSAPNSTYGEGLLIPEGNPKDIHSYDDFVENEDLKVAIMSGADQLEFLQEYGVPQSQMVMINNNADAISAVASGRADAYAATGQTAYNLAKKSDKLQIVEEFEDPVIDGEEVRSWGGFVFDKSSDSFREAFNEALKEYKQTDEWAETLHGYGFSKTDTEQSFNRTPEELCSE